MAPLSTPPTADRPPNNGPTSNRPTSNRPTSDRPTSDRPTADRPPSNRPASDRPTDREAATHPTVPAPPVERPATLRPTAPDPAEVAAVTAEALQSATPSGTIISRSPVDPAGAFISRSSVESGRAPGASAPPPVDLGERFLRELGRSPDVAARELPRPFQPLATAITGSARQVKLSTDATTRRALDTVGKQAVTVGDTIHMARPVRDDVRTHEVLAHELVHVANPSPVPRFFDDDHRGPEERMAEQVAQVIRRSPIMPASPVPSGSQGAPSTSAPSPMSAAAAVASSGSAGVIRRSPAAHGSPGSPSPSPQSPFRTTDADTIHRAPDISVRRSEDAVDGTSDDGPPFDANSAEESDWFDNLVERTVDRVVHHIEQRVMIEFERRGGRHWRNL